MSAMKAEEGTRQVAHAPQQACKTIIAVSTFYTNFQYIMKYENQRLSEVTETSRQIKYIQAQVRTKKVPEDMQAKFGHML